MSHVPQTELPQTGGSYIRHPDGRLELVEGSETAAVPLAVAPELTPDDPPKTARKGALKAPLKE